MRHSQRKRGATDRPNLRSTAPVLDPTIDLNGFKQINDTYGHGVGDLFLQHAALRLKNQLLPGDMLSRIGGDEFAILLSSVPNRSHTVEIVHRLERCFDSPFSIGDLQIQGSASMGEALYPEDGNDTETLLRAADMEMYAVKRRRHETDFYAP